MSRTPITPRKPDDLLAVQSRCGVCGRECYRDKKTSLPIHMDDDSPLCIMVQSPTYMPFVLPKASPRKFTDAECEDFVWQAWDILTDAFRRDHSPWVSEKNRAIARFALAKIDAARRLK